MAVTDPADGEELADENADMEVLLGLVLDRTFQYQREIEEEMSVLRDPLYGYDDEERRRPPVEDVLSLIGALGFFQKFLEEQVIPIADGELPPEAREEGLGGVGDAADNE